MFLRSYETSLHFVQYSLLIFILENRSADTTRDSKRLKFSQIDINQIMNGAQLLLSSSGVEFDSSLDEGIGRLSLYKYNNNIQ